MNNRNSFRSIVALLGLALLSLPFAVNSQTKMPAPWSSSLVKINAGGKLEYVPDEKGNIIPDFSLVGYHQGDVSLPKHRVTMEISAMKGDNWSHIQKAIDKISSLPLDANGHRGVLLLKRGTYPVSKSLEVKASGVVIMGEGSNPDETRLIATTPERYSLISISGDGGREEVAGTRVSITDDFVPVGTHSFRVSSGAGFRKGDKVVVYRPGTQKWIHDIKMDQIVERKGTRQWQPHEYNLAFERTITRVDGNILYIDNPVVMEMEAKYGGGEVFKYTFDGRISEVGICNLHLESAFDNYEDNKHGWIGIRIDKAENCWVENVTARYFGYSAVSCERNSKNITVNNCRNFEPKSVITGGNRYGFNNVGQLNLFMNCQCTEGRHDYITGSQVCGPNVFYNCTASQTYADIGPHHRWAVATLYDNIVTDGELNVQDRGKMGSGHGWAGVNQVLWNCHVATAVVQSPWTSGKNYSIGTKGKKVAGAHPDRPDGVWEGHNETNVFPRSLYMAQLMARHNTDLSVMNKN